MLTVRVPERFRLVRELGRGGMGSVYEALDQECGGRVAIKSLRSKDPIAVARFKREFRALQDIEHPNLVNLGELFCEGDQWSFSMDLIEGVELIDYIRDVPHELPDDVAYDKDTGSLPTVPRQYSVPPGGVSSVSLVPASPPGGGYDEGRLRHAFVQLALGLVALHGANKIHRDIKPSNVRVREDGHLFLLDFGLVVELRDDEHLTAHQNVLGTPAYMAPEHACGEEIGPPADWYSVGVVLFEALTGRLPFEGNAMKMMMAKQNNVAPRPSEFVHGIASDLDDLCAKLLEFNPNIRASAEPVLGLLGGRRVTVPRMRPRSTHSTGASPFIGRQEQLAVLERAFQNALLGEASAVVLVGESGTGKSCLAQRFVDRIQLDHPGAVVIAGRCHENEAVPYNAWDSAIESFSSYWRRLPPEEAGALLPTYIGPLTQTFPTLHRVPAANRVAARMAPLLDPREVRRRAFSALRDLLERATQRGPTVVFIDDIQWIDDDSVSLLAEVLRGPSAPPILFLATLRPNSTERELEMALREALQKSAIYCSVPPLGHDEAVELAVSLLGSLHPARDQAALSIAKEANGHALFITELARYVGETGHEVTEPLSLAAALWARLEDLSPSARSLITVLSVAARPLSSSIAGRAAGVSPSELPRVLAALRVSHLIRTKRLDGVEWLEVYHDRVRGAVVGRMDAEARRKIAEQIARALEASPHAEANLLSDYWRAAGDVERATTYARTAGDEAALALAFERAATFYELALERPSLSSSDRQALLVVHGDTLAKAGRGKEAAQAYERARVGAVQAQLFELERKAGEQLLRAGYYDDGIEVTRRELRRLGIRFPTTVLETILTLVTLRIFLAIRGRRFTEQDERAVPARELARIDVCNNIGSWLLMADSLRAIVFQLHHLRFALAAGEVRRVSTSLSYEMARVGVFNAGHSKKGLARLRGQIARATEVAASTREPYQQALAAMSAGVALVSACLPREGVERLEAAEWVLREKCWGKTWEIVSAQLWSLRGYFCLGEYGALGLTQSRALQETAERRELYGTINLRIGYANFAWLVRDDVESAQGGLLEAAERRSGRGFAMEQNYALFAAVNLHLYRGEAGEALALVEREWGALKASRIRLLPGGRYMSNEYRARAHLALAREDEGERPRNLAAAERWMRDLARTACAYSGAVVALLRAQAAAVIGDEAESVRRLREALPRLVEQDLGGYLAVARRALGKLVGGDEGASLVAESEAFLHRQGVKNIAALSRCLAPGFG